MPYASTNEVIFISSTSLNQVLKCTFECTIEFEQFSHSRVVKLHLSRGYLFVSRDRPACLHASVFVMLKLNKEPTLVKYKQKILNKTLTLKCLLSICSHCFNLGAHIEITGKIKIRGAGIRIKSIRVSDNPYLQNHVKEIIYQKKVA